LTYPSDTLGTFDEGRRASRGRRDILGCPGGALTYLRLPASQPTNAPPTRRSPARFDFTLHGLSLVGSPLKSLRAALKPCYANST
jgi:hypothetical protein